MNLFLCSHFSSVGSLIKEEIENKKIKYKSKKGEDMDETVFMFALFKCRKFDKRRN